MQKKILSFLTAFLLLALCVGPVFAAKPATSNGAAFVNWNLSGEVMPVPPYGGSDIVGSDTASKLIVNEPKGAVEAAITGVMNDLNPNNIYTVYLSKAYTPYEPTNVVGTYTWLVLGTYSHDLVITTQNADGTFSGYGGYPAGANTYQTTEVITGKFAGNQIEFTTVYQGPYNPGYTATVKGTINADSSMSGTVPWEWHTTSGAATLASGSTGWPGLFTSTVQPFTFVTDEYGSGSWHLNLRDNNFPASGTFTLSIWINGGGRTILISDTFEVTVEK